MTDSRISQTLTLMTRVEIVCPVDLSQSLSELIRATGATGYTSVASVSGLGHGGHHNGPNLFNDRDALTMIITVLPPDKAPALIDAIRTLLTGDSGVMFVSDTHVSRPSYFQ